MGGPSKAMTVGERIAQARLTKGAQRGKAMTQTELARMAGVMPATVSQWESGTVTPSLSTIPKIAEALDVTAGYLAFGEPLPAPATWTPDVEGARRITDEEVAQARARRDAERAATTGTEKKADGGRRKRG